jgi:hypothetical protein
MPQHPNYNYDAPMKDVDTLLGLTSKMVRFGLMHEDGANEIETAMKKLYITDDMVKEFAEENYYDLDDMDSIRDEMMWDIDIYECVPEDLDDQREFVHILNVAIGTMLSSNRYGCVYDAIVNEKMNG